GSRAARTSAARPRPGRGRSRDGRRRPRRRSPPRAPSRAMPTPPLRRRRRRRASTPLPGPPQARAHAGAERPRPRIAPVGEPDLGADLERAALEQVPEHRGDVDLLDGLADLEAQPLEELAARPLALVDGEVRPVLGDRVPDGLADRLLGEEEA